MELTNRVRPGRSSRFANAFNLNTKSNAKQYVTVFFWTLAISLVIFIPFVIMDGGYFIYLGDFNCQQIPFYIEVNESIRNGEFFWNWNTDLGANLIGSYAFYLIGSPFFWLALLLPLNWVGPSIPFLICIKTAVAATTAFAYLKRFLRNRNSAFIGAMLYAFSGFAFYNIFFNHFHDIIALFPLLLFGLEKLMADGKKGWFAAAVFLNALTNYYFFVAEAVFLLIYFTLRLITKGWGKFDWKRFVACGVEAVLGFVLAAFVVLPAVLTTLQIERAGTKLSGWALITYYEVQRPYQILQAFFLPPEVPSAPNVFPDAGAKWSSVTAWLPLFGFTGAMTWLQRRPRDFFSKLCVVLFVMAFVPALNAAFQLFSNSYYTRWFFVFVLMLALITMKAVEECSWEQWRLGIVKTGLIALGLCVPVALIKNPETGTVGLAPNMPLLWAHILITVVCLSLTFILMYLIKKRDGNMARLLTVYMTLFVTAFGIFYVAVSRGHSSIRDAQLYAERNTNGRWNMEFKLEDGERIDTINTETNAAMYWNMPSIRAFHSVVPGSIFDFYKNIGVTRDVKTEPPYDNYALQSLLSVRYLIDGENNADAEHEHMTFLRTDNGNSIYEYEYYIPMGFTYTEYMTRSELMANYVDVFRDDVMLSTLVVEDDQADLVDSVLDRASASDIRRADLDVAEQSALRAAKTVDGFSIDKNGFTCSFTSDTADVVFFSVPWEAGWSATVNGEPAEIIRSNLGFMSVVCPAGTSQIRFEFMTPGLIPGLIAAGAALVLLVAYILIGGPTIHSKAVFRGYAAVDETIDVSAFTPGVKRGVEVSLLEFDDEDDSGPGAPPDSGPAL